MKSSAKLSLGERWARWRGPLVWLVIGLVGGPLVSSAMGWQVTSRAARHDVTQAIVHQQAAMCEMRVHQHVKDLSHLNFNQQSALAQKYAKFPWQAKTRNAVVDQCTNALAAQSTAAADAAVGHGPHA